MTNPPAALILSPVRRFRFHDGWRASLLRGVLGLVLTAGSLTFEATTGPHWLKWLGIGLMSMSIAFLEAARQKRRNSP
jgi:hypothetical protein